MGVDNSFLRMETDNSSAPNTFFSLQTNIQTRISFAKGIQRDQTFKSVNDGRSLFFRIYIHQRYGKPVDHWRKKELLLLLCPSRFFLSVNLHQANIPRTNPSQYLTIPHSADRFRSWYKKNWKSAPSDSSNLNICHPVEYPCACVIFLAKRTHLKDTCRFFLLNSVSNFTALSLYII